MTGTSWLILAECGFASLAKKQLSRGTLNRRTPSSDISNSTTHLPNNGNLHLSFTVSNRLLKKLNDDLKLVKFVRDLYDPRRTFSAKISPNTV